MAFRQKRLEVVTASAPRSGLGRGAQVAPHPIGATTGDAASKCGPAWYAGSAQQSKGWCRARTRCHGSLAVVLGQFPATGDPIQDRLLVGQDLRIRGDLARRGHRAAPDGSRVAFEYSPAAPMGKMADRLHGSLGATTQRPVPIPVWPADRPFGGPLKDLVDTSQVLG